MERVGGDDVDVSVEGEWEKGGEPGEGEEVEMSPVVDVEAEVGK